MLRQYLHSEFVLILTVTWKKASCLMPHKEDLKFKLQPHKDTPLSYFLIQVSDALPVWGNNLGPAKNAEKSDNLHDRYWI